MKTSSRGLVGLALLCLAPLVCAQAFPTKSITLVVPYPPGGAADTIGRVMAKALAPKLGQTIVVENKAGAGTAIGAQAVSQAAPDGYTLLITGNTSFTINAALKRKLPYDPIDGFTPIGLLGHTPLVLLANPNTAANNLKELTALANAQPGKLSFGSFGIGTSAHFAGEMLKVMGNLPLTHVPYKGSAPAMTDLIGGQIALSFDTVTAAAPQVAAGKVKALGVTSKARSSKFPNLPSLAEQGLNDMDFVAWIAIVGPKDMNSAAQAALTKALAQVMADASVRQELDKVGLEVNYQPPTAFRPLVMRELPMLRAFVHKAGIPVE
jgi:tripartite-type tricarboxylate transporter receptor subunit TctC